MKVAEWWVDVQGKLAHKPNWREGSPEEAHAWLMHKKVCPMPLHTHISHLQPVNQVLKESSNQCSNAPLDPKQAFNVSLN